MSEELESLLRQMREMCHAQREHPFPNEDLRALRQVFEDEFAALGPHELLEADLNMFCYTVDGWACGGITVDLPDAGRRYRAKVWLDKSFYERFPQYRFLEKYDLSEYPLLWEALEVSERLRRMLLETIRVYEAAGGA